MAWRLSSLIKSILGGDENYKLLKAAKNGNLMAVQTALANGADINAKEKNGGTSLLISAASGHTEVVKLLLEKGADVNFKLTDGITALWMASHQAQTEVIKLLIENGADVNVKRTPPGCTALMISSETGYKENAILLLEKGADVNSKDTDGRTALWMASLSGHTELVKLLLEKGADVNSKLTDGRTVLWMASLSGHTELVKLLLEKGADFRGSVRVMEKHAEVSALEAAVVEEHVEVVKLLLQKGAFSMPYFLFATKGHNLPSENQIKNNTIRSLLTKYAHPDVADQLASPYQGTNPATLLYKSADRLQHLIDNPAKYFLLPFESGIKTRFLDGSRISHSIIQDDVGKLLFGLNGQAEAWRTGCFRGEPVQKVQLLNGLDLMLNEWNKIETAWSMYGVKGSGMSELKSLRLEVVEFRKKTKMG